MVMVVSNLFATTGGFNEFCCHHRQITYQPREKTSFTMPDAAIVFIISRLKAEKHDVVPVPLPRKAALWVSLAVNTTILLQQ
jgi:hypothetical protein